MVGEADRFVEEDRRRREQASKLNDTDAICYQGERFLADFGDKISSDLRARIEVHIRDIKAAASSKDTDAATAHAEALKKVLQEAGTSVYAGAAAREREAREAGAPPEEPATRTSEPGERGRVIDAEYRESKP